MKSITALGVGLALGSSIASAEPWLEPGNHMTCSGYKRPSYDDCDFMLNEDPPFEGNDDVFHENGEQDWSEPSCKWWYHDSGGNCKVTHCYIGTNDEAGQTLTRTGKKLWENYKMIKGECDGWRAGGTYNGDWDILDVFSDDDKRSVPEKLKVLKRSDNGVVTGHTSLEDYLEWRNDTRPERENEVETVNLPRSVPSRVEKHRRDDDTEVRWLFAAYGVRNPNEFERGPRLTSGVDYEYEVTETTTFSVSTSMELGAAFDIFTASVGMEMTQTDEFSVREGLTFSVDCPNMGQITFHPFYDYYQVQFYPSEEVVDIWMPVPVGDKKIGGEIAVECSG